MSAFDFAFGDVAHDLASFKKSRPDLKFISLKQTHSDHVVSSNDVLSAAMPIEADALWSDRDGEALCIQTADCTPVLFFAPRASARPLIAAAHAGWRGVASNIVGKTVAVLRAQGADVSQMRALIGPHIRVESFEVGLDVAGQLSAAYSLFSSLGEITVPHADPSKRYVNLERMVTAQLIAGGLALTNIQLGADDTFSDRRYHSFRRDATAAGRQTSFIALG